MRLRVGVVWLSQTWPIKRRWRVRWGQRTLLSVPMRTVRWSRNADEKEALEAHDWGGRDWDRLERVEEENRAS